MKFFHKDLLWYLMFASIISIFCAVFGWIGFFAPELLGWPPSTPLIIQLALIVLGFMPIFVILSIRLHLRAYWVYKNIKPTKMELQIKIEEDSDSRRYYVLLKSNLFNEQAQKIPVFAPGWDIKRATGIISADIFIDPATQKPLVMEINGKRLWSMAL